MLQGTPTSGSTSWSLLPAWPHSSRPVTPPSHSLAHIHGAPSAEPTCTSRQAVWLQDVWAGPPSTAPVVGLGQQTESQPSLPSLVLPADKGILERSSSADVGSLLPLSNLDGPDTPPGYQPGSLLRSKSLGGSGSDEGSPGGSATPPMGAAAEREPLLPSLLLPAGAPLWDHRQRGCSPRVRCRELWGVAVGFFVLIVELRHICSAVHLCGLCLLARLLLHQELCRHVHAQCLRGAAYPEMMRLCFWLRLRSSVLASITRALTAAVPSQKANAPPQMATW